MSDPLEAVFRKAIREGFLSLSLSKEWDGDKWQVSYRTTGTTSIQNFRGVDPVETMKMALRSGIRAEATLAPEKPEHRLVKAAKEAVAFAKGDETKGRLTRPRQREDDLI